MTFNDIAHSEFARRYSKTSGDDYCYCSRHGAAGSSTERTCYPIFKRCGSPVAYSISPYRRMDTDGDFIHWITRTAAGMRQPGLHGELRADLLAVRRAGISVIVSLTVDPVPERDLMRCGIKGRHFPILGMGIPLLEPTIDLCQELSRELTQGSKIAFHCTAGVGRTGMMLACHLISRGNAATDAIVRVRDRIPRAIQTSGQEAFVHRFAEASNPRAARRH